MSTVGQRSSPFALGFRTKRHLRFLAFSTSITTVGGFLYPFVVQEAHAHLLIMGTLAGAFIGATGGLAEGFLFPTLRRELTFAPFLLVRTLFYVGLVVGSILLVTVQHAVLMNSVTHSAVFALPEFRGWLYGGEFTRVVLYGLGLGVSFNLLHEMNRLLGHRVLWNYLLGRYHHPTEEERVFMFLDLKSSTTIAERLGHVRYHRFLNDFFFDITPAITASRGQIHQYVGDEIVVTWTSRAGLQDARCIQCFFRIEETIRAAGTKYVQRYGVVPAFHAAIHMGPVVTGEVGDVKREIAFHGDTMNTTARIRTECSRVGKDLLVSAELLARVSLDRSLRSVPIGTIQLRGKEREVDLFALEPAA
jgi:adenylate cyclase